MTIEQKVSCIFDEIKDQNLSQEQAKLYIEGAEHAFCLCYPEQISNINKLFDVAKETK